MDKRNVVVFSFCLGATIGSNVLLSAFVEDMLPIVAIAMDTANAVGNWRFVKDRGKSLCHKPRNQKGMKMHQSMCWRPLQGSPSPANYPCDLIKIVDKKLTKASQNDIRLVFFTRLWDWIPAKGRYCRPQRPPASGAPTDFTQKGGGWSLRPR